VEVQYALEAVFVKIGSIAGLLFPKSKMDSSSIFVGTRQSMCPARFSVLQYVIAAD
jgi:hypothetical protein